MGSGKASREQQQGSSSTQESTRAAPTAGKVTRAAETAPHGNDRSAASSPARSQGAPQRDDDWNMTDDLSTALGLAPEPNASYAHNSSEDVCRPEDAAAAGDIAAPKAGVNKPGFIDHSDGANIRTGPAEAGGTTLRSTPLPPATRVFVSGTHPSAPQWWYVTAFLPDEIVRGYVQDLRVTTDLPEPTAKLYQVQSGDTAEGLAVQEFKSAVRDGHDLRYYENVLLKVNRDRGRAGIIGSFQAPGLLGGGSNNVQLVAGHRIWLVSPAYARAVEGEVPDGSLTNGGYAKAKRFAAHLQDILQSVTQSPQFLGEVAGEFAQAIADHMPLIVGMVAGFITLEAASALLAAVPTGVSQIVAVLIQLLLAAIGAAGMVEAGVQAAQHGGRWLNLAWTAQGDQAKLAAASKEFLKMLVALAMAALAYAGVKGNVGKALKIADSMPMPMPAFAVAGGGQLASGGAGTAVAIGGPGPLTGLGAGGSMMVKGEGGGSGASKSNSFPRRSLVGVSLKWLQKNKPRGWRQVPTREYEGWIWLDNAGRERLRFMRSTGSNPASNRWSRQANGYFRWQDEAGGFLDANGNAVPANHPKFQELTHIMYEGPL